MYGENLVKDTDVLLNQVKWDQEDIGYVGFIFA